MLARMSFALVCRVSFACVCVVSVSISDVRCGLAFNSFVLSRLGGSVKSKDGASTTILSSSNPAVKMVQITITTEMACSSCCQADSTSPFHFATVSPTKILFFFHCLVAFVSFRFVRWVTFWPFSILRISVLVFSLSTFSPLPSFGAREGCPIIQTTGE